MILDSIQKANDIKQIPSQELDALAEEIRTFLVEKVSKSGGHLASNLGAVELTMALHLFCEFPKDKIVWDVGHQSYTHKLLTGRRAGFDTLRQYGGMSGFPKRKESDCDSFDTGHSSTSISAGLGLAMARDIKGEDHHVISVIGDGALTGGMAYEALNNAAALTTNFIIVLNDNNMSISENVGGISNNLKLSDLRTSERYLGFKQGIESSLRSLPGGEHLIEQVRRTKDGIKKMIIPGMLFEEMGLTYLGPVDGHNIPDMLKTLQDAARVPGAVVVHVKTKKGKGYLPAERHPARFHGTDRFDIETGLVNVKGRKAKYTDVFSTVMKKLGDRNESVVAITAAMSDGTGLKRFAHYHPDRFFDVGIAEEHAVTFAAALAQSGLRPVVAVYSSFLQRAFDQIVHDVCIQNLPVVFAIDRAGLVGSDGETHHGAFDLSYLSMIPNMHIMAPKNKWELSDMMKFAVAFDGPIAVRYPRGTAYDGLEEYRQPIHLGKSETIKEGKNVAILALGSMVKVAKEVCEQLEADGITPTFVNARFVKPLDTECIDRLAASHSLLVTMEENALCGGFGEKVQCYLAERQANVLVLRIGIPDQFISQGSVDELFAQCKMDAASVTAQIREKIQRG
jgi:1-deoxy-D-xylulose-5-phosphate synthase